MRSKRPLVSPEDQELFLAAVGGAIPLPRRDRLPVAPVPSVVRVAELPPERALTIEGDGQRYAARGPGVSRAQIQALRAGNVHAAQTLDLHGETVERGLARLRTFLLEASQLGHRCVLVVHGKGTHSDHGAPLREAVLAELLGPLSGLLHALSTAAAGDGGEGATYVMLRGSR
jgi:DNA-nicking Smr family endonuclease